MALTPPPSARGLGYIPDRPDARDHAARELVATRGVRVATPDFRAYRQTRLLQGAAGACFAFAATRAIHVSLQLQGAVEPPIPSPSFIYWNGRAQEYKDLPEHVRPRVLEDVGTRPRPGMDANRGCGFTPWDAAPYDARQVRTRPPRDAYFRAHDQRGLAYYRIADESRVDGIARAMQAGATVILCMQVDTPFLWNRGDVIRNVDFGALEGGHAMAVLDVTRGTVDVDNWWEDWGVPANRWEDDGIGRLSVDLVNSHPAIMDVYAVEAAPLYTGGAA